MPLFFKSLQIISLGGIDAKAAAATKVFTTENGTRNYYFIGASLECTAASGISVPCSASVGTNSTAYNNVISSLITTGLVSSLLHIPTPMNAVMGVVMPNTDVYMKVNTPAVGTSQILTIHLIGFYA